MSDPQRILIIDDEPDIRELLEITLSRMNLATASAGTLAEARQLLKSEDFRLCLTDMRLPDGDGLTLVREIQNLRSLLPVAVITAHGSTETAIDALKSGAFDFISKPVDLNKLRSLVTSALRLSDSTSTQGDSSALERIVGNSRAIDALRQQIAKLARSQAPVCITGESGSGKELVARAIHRQGPRKEREFIAINCGAIPSELMESEFFGHRKGSFTGADQDKTGLFQAAHGGSLFLDEIAELPLHMQVKLLRAIQEKAIRPVGSQQEVPVDIRLISATHRNLTEQVAGGTLRQDLYYRINVIELKVPPLRERRDDIPLLVDHILQKLGRESDREPHRVSNEVLQAMQGYAFPGNIRELENMLQRACALAEDTIIGLNDLPELGALPDAEDRFGEPQPDDHFVFTPEVDGDESYSLEKHLERIEREAIEKALQDSKWNRTAAARKLGMSFRSFRYRLKKLGMD